MRTHTPHRWVLVQLVPTDGSAPYKRIFATWHGGFATGDSWKLSSGNFPAFDTGNTWLVPQASGSEYILGKENYSTSLYSSGVLSSLIENSKNYVIITVMEQPTTVEEFV